jgi:phosphomannomutase
MAGIFKAYDIRGIYGKDLTEEIAHRIGRAFQTFLGCKSVVVARDMRPHSDALFRGLSKGLTIQGADVIDIGLASTPVSYFANGALGADAGIMITASHNPGEWNGFKLCREQAIPISGSTGIQDIFETVSRILQCSLISIRNKRFQKSYCTKMGGRNLCKRMQRSFSRILAQRYEGWLS